MGVVPTAMSKVIGVRMSEPQRWSDEPEGDVEVEWHARGHGVTDHDTLCGIDANDPGSGHFGCVEAKRGQKVTCRTCKRIWEGVAALKLRANDFDVKN